MYEITTVMDEVTQVWSAQAMDFLFTLAAHGYEIMGVVVC